MRVVCVEDDASDEQKLESQLARYAEEHGVTIDVLHITSADSLLEGELEYDMVFMDIDLPGTNGIESARLLREMDPESPLVFVTSLAQYAVKGYEFDAIGFIVKPARYYDLSICLNKAIRVLDRKADEMLSFSTRAGIVAYPISSISYVETNGHSLVFHFSSGEEPFTVRGTMGALEKQLDGKSFIRISQGQMVNLAHIARVETNAVIMPGGKKLFFSRQRRKTCMARIAQYIGRTI